MVKIHEVNGESFKWWTPAGAEIFRDWLSDIQREADGEFLATHPIFADRGLSDGYGYWSGSGYGYGYGSGSWSGYGYGYGDGSN